MINKEEEIKKLEQEIKSCKKCELWKTRTNALCGEGFLDAKIMFIAEAPGFNEDLQGKHFIGKAGGIFDKLLDSIKLNRKKAYITNVLKCKLSNKKIKSEYLDSCTSYLDKQIEIIKPEIIVPLGKLAMVYIFKKYKIKEQSIGKVHGEIFSIKNLLFEMKIIPQFHPAVAIYNPEMMGVLIKDFEKIK